MTFDQANRLVKYEIYRDLGLDQSPWSPPIQITLTAWAEAVDANGNILKKAMPGQVITLDPSAFFEYAGDYEIMEPDCILFRGTRPAMLTEYSGEVTGSGSMTQMTDQNAGRIILLLRTYNPDVFFDVSDAEAAGYFTVPGQELWAGPGPVNSNYQVLSDTLSATDAGTSVTIAWSGVQLQSAVAASFPTRTDRRSVSLTRPRSMPSSTTHLQSGEISRCSSPQMPGA